MNKQSRNAWFQLEIPIGWDVVRLEVISPKGKKRILYCKEMSDRDRRVLR